MYLKSYNQEAKTTINANLDFIIKGERGNIVMFSICDIGVNVRGVLANLNTISENKSITIKQYDNISKETIIDDVHRCYPSTPSNWLYKICKNEKYTHGIAYNKKLINNTIIDFEGNNKYKLIATFLSDNHNIPVDEEVVKLIDNEKPFNELEVWSAKSTNIKAYYISEYNIKNIIDMLKRIKLPFNDNNISKWDSINTVSDYVLEFNKDIRKVMDKNIDIRFDSENDLPNMDMFKYKRIPYKGQVALIESGVRTLKHNKRVIYTCEMGTGKSTIGTMCNDLYMKEKGKVNYLTLVVVPNATLKKWRDEIYTILGKSVDVVICTSTVEFIRFMKQGDITKPTYVITSKETAKLGFKRYPGVNYGTSTITYEEENDYGRIIKKQTKENNLALCPKCGMPMINNAKKKGCSIDDEYLKEKHFKSIKKSNYKCPNCNEVLWSAVYQKTVKTSLMDYCHRKNIKFDSLIWDEFHNEKNISSATGTAFGNILKMSDVKILLSGTMNNGNVSSLFPLLMRLIPRKMFKDGYTMQDMDKFIKTYGSLKATKVIKDDEQRSTNRTMFKDSDFSEIAGVNPIVFTKYLSDICISATMDDLGIDMVKYTEYPVEIEMEEELKNKYNTLSSTLKRTIPYNFEMYNGSVIRHYINNPFNWTHITVKKATPDGFDLVKIDFNNMDRSKTLKKEDKLIELVQSKLKVNKKCLVFTDFTGGNSKYQEGEIISDRLVRLLKERGIIAKCLKASIKPIDRMEYINNNPEVEVWITNPILVKEGLDLIDYPVIIFYNFDYEPMKIQQASRRAWRSIQTVDCETYYFYYKDSVEEKIMKTITLKKMEMEAIEGKFSLDDFNLVKRTASQLGKELYDCINIEDSLGKLNGHQVKASNIKLRSEVEEYYK